MTSMASAPAEGRMWAALVLSAALGLQGCSQPSAAGPPSGGPLDGGPATPKDSGPDLGMGPGPMLTGLCWFGDYCWENPLPQGSSLLSLWEHSPDDLWVGGWGGLILHGDGNAFKLSHLNPRSTDTGATVLSGISSDDIWALTGGGMPPQHWDGLIWLDVPAGTDQPLHAIWASGPKDVWFAGDGGALRRWNGSQMLTVPSGTTQSLVSIRGTAPDDVWFFSNGFAATTDAPFLIWHWDGTQVRALSTGLPGRRSLMAPAVWPIGPNDVWAAGGDNSDIVHFDGTSFQSVPHPLGRYTAVWASGPKDVWFSGADGIIVRWDGHALIDMHGPGFPLRPSIWGSGPDNVWMIEQDGDYVHWNGTTWAVVKSGGTADFIGITGTGKGDVWMYGGGGLLQHWDGVSLRNLTRFAGIGQILGAFAAGPDDAWASSYDGIIVRRQGSAWTQVESGTSKDLYGMGGSGPDDIWAVGGAIVHFDGTSFSLVQELAGFGLQRVWASGPKDAWAIGQDSIMHLDGTSWSIMTSGKFGSQPDVWGSGADDVWFTTGSSNLLHWTGDALHTVPCPGPPGYAPSRLFGTGAADVWAVGGYFAAHWDGMAWKQVAANGPYHEGLVFTSLWGTGPSDIWAAAGESRGDTPSLYHFDGKYWNGVPEQTPFYVQTVWGSGKHLWIGGGEGQIMHHNL